MSRLSNTIGKDCLTNMYTKNGLVSFKKRNSIKVTLISRCSACVDNK